MRIKSITGLVAFFGVLVNRRGVHGLSLQQRQKPDSATATAVTRRKLLLQAAIISFGAAPTLLLDSSNPAGAYPRRDVGGDNPSALTAAANEQAYITNNRLEASGFHLDTPEEEQARIGQAMASFSYDDANSNIKGKKQTAPRDSRTKQRNTYKPQK